MSRHLMAEMRQANQGPELDWQMIFPTPEDPSYGNPSAWQAWQADLENGHSITVHNTDGQWKGCINHPGIFGPDYGKDSLGDAMFPHSTTPDESWSNREEAARGMEAHYKNLFPLGTNTGGHDSGVDYDDIIKNYRDYL